MLDIFVANHSLSILLEVPVEVAANQLQFAGPIVQYVQNLALHSGEIEDNHDSEEAVVDQGKVTLTTIHSCKGMF